MDFEGKVVLVTGSSRGIGRDTARLFASRGGAVIVHGRSESKQLAEAYGQVAGVGKDSAQYACDLADSDAIRRMFQFVQERYGRLDVLVNNAVYQEQSPFLDISESSWDHMFEVNLKAVFLCCQLAGRMMASKGGGKIINVGSVHELQPRRFFAPYSIAKSALLMLTKSAALELAEFNIQVNQVAPGAIATALTDAERQSSLMSAIPAGRIGTTAEVAELICFLASSQSDYITGASVVADGGLTLGFCASRRDL